MHVINGEAAKQLAFQVDLFDETGCMHAEDELTALSESPYSLMSV